MYVGTYSFQKLHLTSLIRHACTELGQFTSRLCDRDLPITFVTFLTMHQVAFAFRICERRKKIFLDKLFFYRYSNLKGKLGKQVDQLGSQIMVSPEIFGLAYSDAPSLMSILVQVYDTPVYNGYLLLRNTVVDRVKKVKNDRARLFFLENQRNCYQYFSMK